MSWQDAMVPNYGVPALTLVRGEGHLVWDDQGKMYTDLMAGIAVNVLGHAHPAVVQAVQQQVARLAHTSNLYAHPQGVRLAERLAARSGKRVMFTNSGTEANEAALKAVRRAAADEGRSGVVLAFQGSFHGRTLGSLALTGQPKHQAGFGPLPEGIVHVPFNDVDALQVAFERHEVIGVFAECVQGEGGVVPMASGTAAALDRLCRSHGARLVIDEVQTGVGRTGTFFAYEQTPLRPDAVSLAKGLGGGMPLGACLLSPELAQVMGPGTHGCTFGGNAVSCAAGNAVLDVLDEGLLEQVGPKADAWRARLGEAGLAVRGQGLLLGLPVGLDRAADTAGAAAAAGAVHAADAVRSLLARGILAGQAGPSVLRLAPPLTIPADVLDAAVPALAEAVGLAALTAG